MVLNVRQKRIAGVAVLVCVLPSSLAVLAGCAGPGIQSARALSQAADVALANPVLRVDPKSRSVLVWRPDEQRAGPNAKRPYIKVTFGGRAAEFLRTTFINHTGGRLVDPDRVLDCRDAAEGGGSTCSGWFTGVKVTAADNPKQAALSLSLSPSVVSESAPWPIASSYFFRSSEELKSDLKSALPPALFFKSAHRLSFGKDAVRLLLVADGTVDHKFGFLIDKAIQTFNRIKVNDQKSVFDPALAHMSDSPKTADGPSGAGNADGKLETREVSTKDFSCGNAISTPKGEQANRIAGEDVYCSFPSAAQVVIDNQ